MARKRSNEAPEAALSRWRESIDKIANDLTAALGRHRVWEECSKLWMTNRALWVKSDVWTWMLKAHTDSMALAIRREAETGPKFDSLRNLVDELVRKAQLVTCE